MALSCFTPGAASTRDFRRGIRRLRAQLDYLQSRGFAVHCVLCKVLGQVPHELSRFAERFPCVQSISVLDVPAKALKFRDLLFGYAQAAASEQFRRVVRERFDLFLANYVVTRLVCMRPAEIPVQNRRDSGHPVRDVPDAGPDLTPVPPLGTDPGP